MLVATVFAVNLVQRPDDKLRTRNSLHPKKYSCFAHLSCSRFCTRIRPPSKKQNKMFEHEYVSHATVDGKVLLQTRAVTKRKGGAPSSMRVLASRMIKATGFDIKIKVPMRFTNPESVNSLAPIDVRNHYPTGV